MFGFTGVKEAECKANIERAEREAANKIYDSPEDKIYIIYIKCKDGSFIKSDQYILSISNYFKHVIEC